MRRIFVLSLVAVVLLFFSGCGVNRVALKPEKLQNLKTITLIEIDDPVTYVANDFGNIGMMFGAVGGLVAGISSANAGKSIDQIARESGFKANDLYMKLLIEKLEVKGFSVSTIHVEKAKKYELLSDYNVVDDDGSDALLEVVIQSLGYATEHPLFSPHWRPSSQVLVAMMDKRTKEILYREKFMYGYHNPFMPGTNIDAPKSYHFKNNEELFADGNKLVEGMEDSVNSVVERIIDSLKKKG